MKVSIGAKLRSGPWGGANEVFHSLANYLRAKGVEVCFDLQPRDLDIIVLTHIDPNQPSSAYSYSDVVRYLLSRNYRAIVVHRFNHTSEAKGDRGNYYNKTRIAANRFADHAIFLSGYLYNTYVESGFKSPHHSIIFNGGLRPRAMKNRSRREPLKIITHHWSNFRLKGFDVYERLDRLLLCSDWREKVDFTYVGRLPDGFKFENAAYRPPLPMTEVTQELLSHDIYLTASQYEPAGMHHIEGAMCGLPLLYRESGALPEYCNGYGISFNETNFEQKLQEMIDDYDHWASRMRDYPNTAEKMCDDYHRLFLELIECRAEILKRRRWWCRPDLILVALATTWIKRSYRALRRQFSRFLHRFVR